MSYILKYIYKTISIAFILVIFSGCSLIRGPFYHEIIYNNRQPLISVTYEYGEIELILPLKYDAAIPDNILFKVYAQGDTIHPILTILQESPKDFLAYLPQGVLDIQNMTNIVKIIPQDNNFDPIQVRFKGIRFGRLSLPRKTIKMGQIVVKGKTFLNKNDSILPGTSIALQNFDNIINTTRSNESGYFQIAIPGEYKFAEHLRIVAGENLIFKPYIEKLNFKGSRKKVLDIGLGPSDELKEPLYMTNKNNVHFRKSPEIGSETLFLLKEGEVISVDKVTPGEYFGFIEVLLDDNRLIQLEGWVNRSDLRLLNFNNLYK
jgi:hypothetical protein